MTETDKEISLNDLSIPDRKFLHHIIRGKRNCDAYQLAHPRCTNRESAYTLAGRKFGKLKPYLNLMLDDCGLSSEALKVELLGLIRAKETKIVTLKGEIKAENLEKGTRILGYGSTAKVTATGEKYTEINTIVAVDQVSLQAKAKGLDMGFKIRGEYAATEVHVDTGKTLTKIIKGLEGATDGP